MTPVQMIVRDLARQGIEPTRRLVRAQLAARHITATDAEIDRVLAVELQRWIVEGPTYPPTKKAQRPLPPGMVAGSRGTQRRSA